MKSAQPIENESARLAALRGYGVLDTGAEREFEDAVAIASYVCGAPVSLVSFVDAGRQWFKARVGLAVQETPRDIAFCAHTVRENRLLIVPDAEADERFADNPLVTGEPHVRFYAGAPIRSAEGLPLGTICVLDRAPRTLTAAQEQVLLALARVVETLLEARKRARDAESRERRLRALEVLVRNTNDAYLQVNPEGIIVSANAAATTLYGYTNDELVGANVEVLGRGPAPAGGRTETVHYMKDGSAVHVEVSVAEPVDAGDPHAFIVRDVSDRVMALREARLTAAMTEHMPDAVVVVARGGEIQRWNAAAEKLYGYSAAEAVGQPATLMHPPDVREAQSAAVREAIQAGGVFRAEVVGMHKDGTRLPIESAVRIMQDSRGETIFLSINRDLRDRKRHEAERSRSEATFRLLAEHATDIIMRHSPEGICLYVTPSVTRIQGFATEEMIGRSAYDFFHPDDVPRIERAHVEVTSTDAPQVLAYRALCKDGTYRWLESVARPVKGPDGNVIEVHSVARDISERKAAEAALVAAKEAAESANRAKSVFLGNMSHELRTPLHAILGFGRVLEKGRFGALNEQQLQYVRDILESGAHMLGLVEELLELRKVEEGRSKREVCEVEIGAAAEEAVRMTRELALKKQHELVIAPSPGAARVLGDHRALVQVLVNLLSNAIKYTPPGGHVRLQWELDAGDVCVHVEDDGVGMTAEEQGRLFRDFERLGRASRGDTSGTGLGLALTRRIVEELGGRVSVTSAAGRGSRFTFRLPAVAPTSDRSASARTTP